jgi:glycosyltransferase involved in cell wall biosynthesis
MALLEASTLTGPAKNLLQFVQDARSGRFNPPVEVLIVIFRRNASPSLFMEQARQRGVAVYPILETGRMDRTVIEHLRRMERELKPDVVQSHAVKSHFLVRASGLHNRLPWVAFHHGYTWPDLRMRLYNQIDRWSLLAARRVVTVSQPFRAELIERGVSQERIEVIHNAIEPQWGVRGTNPERAGRLRESLGIRADKRVILIVGRLSREKDHASLLDVVCCLRSAARRCAGFLPHLLVVGDGPERARLERKIRVLDMPEDVTLVGQVPTAEPYYGIANVAVLSSLSEGSPNALLEAMAAHVPIVATAVGGIPEIVSHRGSAILVQPGDREGMTNAIAELLADPSLGRELADSAHEIVLSRFTPELRAKRLLQIYTAVCEQSPSSLSSPV